MTSLYELYLHIERGQLTGLINGLFFFFPTYCYEKNFQLKSQWYGFDNIIQYFGNFLNNTFRIHFVIQLIFNSKFVITGGFRKLIVYFISHLVKTIHLCPSLLIKIKMGINEAKRDLANYQSFLKKYLRYQ